MQGDADALALDQQAWLVGDECLHHGLCRVDRGEAGGRARGFASARQFKAVGAGEHEIAKAKVAQGRDGSSADDRQPSIEPVAQGVEQGEKVRIDMNPIGPVSDRDQRSVEIEEQGRAMQQG